MKNALSFDKILLNITHVFRKGEFLRKREKEDFILPSKHVSYKDETIFFFFFFFF